MPKCDWSGCYKKAIGGFVETGGTNSSTGTGSFLISETYWCEDHKEVMDQHLEGKTGRRLTFDS
jgi:hypothetical protein